MRCRQLHDAGKSSSYSGADLLLLEFGGPLCANTSVSSECEQDSLRAILSGPMPAPLAPPPASGSLRRRTPPSDTACASSETLDSDREHVFFDSAFDSTAPTAGRSDSQRSSSQWTGPSIKEDEHEASLEAHSSDAAASRSPRRSEERATAEDAPSDASSGTVSPAADDASASSPAGATPKVAHSNPASRARQQADERADTFPTPTPSLQPPQRHIRDPSAPSKSVPPGRGDASGQEASQSGGGGQWTAAVNVLDVRQRGGGGVRLGGALELKTLVKNGRRKTFANWRVFWAVVTADGRLQLFPPKGNALMNLFKRTAARFSVRVN